MSWALGFSTADGLQRVVMVGRCKRDRVDRLVFEKLTDIGVHRRTFLAGLLHVGDAGIPHGLVDIADSRDLYVGHRSIPRDVYLALSMYADAGHPHCVVGARRRHRASCDYGRQRPNQEVSSIHLRVPCGHGNTHRWKAAPYPSREAAPGSRNKVAET
jgi:hypothetical protein